MASILSSVTASQAPKVVDLISNFGGGSRMAGNSEIGKDGDNGEIDVSNQFVDASSQALGYDLRSKGAIPPPIADYSKIDKEKGSSTFLSKSVESNLKRSFGDSFKGRGNGRIAKKKDGKKEVKEFLIPKSGSGPNLVSCEADTVMLEDENLLGQPLDAHFDPMKPDNPPIVSFDPKVDVKIEGEAASKDVDAQKLDSEMGEADKELRSGDVAPIPIPFAELPSDFKFGAGSFDGGGSGLRGGGRGFAMRGGGRSGGFGGRSGGFGGRSGGFGGRSGGFGGRGAVNGGRGGVFRFGNSNRASGDPLSVPMESVAVENSEGGKKEGGVSQVANAWSTKGVTLADKIRGNTDSKIVLSFKPPVVLDDGRTAIRFSKRVVMEGAKANPLLLVAHFVGVKLPFFMVNNNLTRMWKQNGLIDVASNYDGFYLLKFNSEEGMNFVIDNGPWMINGMPLFVRKWEPGVFLGKPELKALPLWVNLHGVPLEVWNVQGLSELASGIGKPLALDRATEERCLKQAGRVGFARVLVEVYADKVLPDEVIGLVPSLDGKSEKEVIICVEYKWKPSRCSHCALFGHSYGNCRVRPLSDDEKVANLKKATVVGDDGFQVVGKNNKATQVRNGGGSNQQVSTKKWVNQRFGGQGSSGSQGILRQPRSAQNVGDGQQKSGGMEWQAKGSVGAKQGQQLGGQNLRSFHAGQSSGVVKEAVGQGTVERRVEQKKTIAKKPILSGKEGGRVGNDGKASVSKKVVDSSGSILEEVGGVETLNKFDALNDLDEDGDDQAWFFDKEEVNKHHEAGVRPPDHVLAKWSKEQLNYYFQLASDMDVVSNDEAPDFMKWEEVEARRGGRKRFPMFKVAIWNIRGLNVASKRNEVRHLISVQRLDVCVVVETKVCRNKLAGVCGDLFGSWEWASNNGVCRGRTRIIVGWNPNVVKIEAFEFFDQVIHCRLFHLVMGKSFHCSFVYAANDTVERRVLWDCIARHKVFVKGEAWVVMGDFNVSLDPSDSSRGTSYVTRAMNDFRECLNGADLFDLNQSGLKFTWIQSRLLLLVLDRILCNLGFLGLFPLAAASFLPYGLSDHSPAVLSVSLGVRVKAKSFKFNNHLVDSPDFLSVVENCWSKKVEGCLMFSVVTKLKELKKGVRKLNLKHGDVFKNVEKFRGELDRAQTDMDLDPDNGEVRLEGAVYLKALKDALVAEEKFLRQRSKVKWLREGDSNTAYFHKVVKVNFNRSRIVEVEDMSGNRFVGLSVAEQFVSHFKSILGTSDSVSSIVDPDSLFVRKLSKHQADFMVRPVSDCEIRDAIFDIDDVKAPGPDGFSSCFFKKAWPVVGSEVCAAVRQFFDNGKLLREVNSTVIALVPKSQTPRNVADFRPIACCNVLFKCISKIIVQRMKGSLGGLVDVNQSAFIPNRQISDNILLAQELMRGYHLQRGIKRCAFKIDIQKAYDTVNWSFLEFILMRFGFHPCMVHWIMMCVTSASFSIRVNGEQCGHFQGMRGIRQGDPLSPYLFTLVMEVLTLMVKRRVMNADGFKFHPKCEKLGITHLCFADDLLMFCHGDVESVNVLKSALFEFSEVSGLKPSLGKSTSFLGNVVGRNREEIMRILPFKLGVLLVRYLGVPLLSTKLFHKDCAGLIDKIKKRVSDWKNKSLSFAGRLQLINSVLSSISVYWASLFLLPVSVVKEIEKLMRRFLWSSGDAIKGKAKVSWKEVCLPKGKGGLGIKSLKCWNKALLAKQIWKLIDNGESVWVKWMHEYRLKGRNFWEVGAIHDASWFWRKVVHIRGMFREQFVHVLGVGRRTSVWFDNWHPAGPLCNFISKRDIYAARLSLDLRVCDMVVDGLWVWPIEIWIKYGNILQMYMPRLIANTWDKLRWKSRKGACVDFDVAAVWSDLFEDFNDFRWANLIWFSHGIPRHAFILWLAIKERLRTLDRLNCWGLIQNPICVLCNDGVESHDHLFVDCCYVQEVWRCCEGLSGIEGLIFSCSGSHNSWMNVIGCLCNRPINKSIWSVVQRLLLAAVVYFVWQERNYRLHQAKCRSAVLLARQIIELIKLKLLGLRVKNSVQVKKVAEIWNLGLDCRGLDADFCFKELG
ncbi:hypothetical protein OSB04_005992 [Centaurea solstitialis]|uniref:Reverse transcriptase domain-containing protein n=1 Tax=Centaurea solstitialis TaxID=347529 RepID=A0AA38U075_9ASTR|nr:hypothetical protein OSB04_005992 [Centaurea solstitialis]